MIGIQSHMGAVLDVLLCPRQCQYSSFFGRLEADQRKVCELQWSGTALFVYDVIAHGQISQAIFAHCK